VTDSFHTRIPTLSDAELQRYVAAPGDFHREAVEAAVSELVRRGLPPTETELARIATDLHQRDAARHPEPHPWFGRLLGGTPALRRFRIRLATAAILAVGFASAGIVYLTAPPAATNPLGYDPLNTKKYLRDLEIYGGKANVLATEFMRWFDGLWHGRALASTLAWLTALAACAFWWMARRRAAELDARLNTELDTGLDTVLPDPPKPGKG